jgi:hypothetical protein
MIWVVEVRGRGVQPYQFATKKDAETFAMATYPWQNLAWRVYRVRGSIKNKGE